ncbi:MAG: PHP domain-containing protein [Armatimonadota bacterium]
MGRHNDRLWEGKRGAENEVEYSVTTVVQEEPVLLDLHVHSTASDGSQTPQEIVRRAHEIGLEAVSITDHDTVAAVAPAQSVAPEGLQVFPGLEISTELGSSEVHILGYFIDCSNTALTEKLAVVRNSRVQRAHVITQKLNALGVSLDYSDVQRHAGSGSVGRPHIAQALVANGTCQNQQEAFTRFLRRGRPAYVPRYKLTPAEGIELIKQAGGLPVLAHPGLCAGESIVQKVLDLGVGGIEAYYTRHTKTDSERYVQMARDRDLLITGGSDSHGPGGPIPVEIGSVDIPDWVTTELLQWAESNNAFITA